MSNITIKAEDVRAKLVALERFLGPYTDEISQYRNLLSEILQNPHNALSETLQIFVDHIVQEHISAAISRPMLSEISQHLSLLNDDISKSISHFILDKMHPREISFAEQIAGIRQYLAKIYEREQNWKEAANILAKIPLETGNNQYSSDYKLEIYLNISRLYLHDENPVEAEQFLNKASRLQNETANGELKIMYKAFHARILDFKNKFIEAAYHYLQLSYCPLICEEECLIALKRAFACTVLATVSKQKENILSHLFKDERSRQLPAYSILEKMYLNRIIKKPELSVFEALLQNHHKAVTADGSTILDNAIFEHNILAASKVYKNIGIEQLGALLQTSPFKAEQMAANLMRENLINGHISQLDGFIYFEDQETLPKWDANINELCNTLDEIMNHIALAEPEWFKKTTSENEKE